ncbi:MAG: BcpO-related WXXGXW repeat protein [Rhodopirellula sp.]|nr:BcpO-related WXXGXW repeat protein [Rhodopirellula sp.]
MKRNLTLLASFLTAVLAAASTLPVRAQTAVTPYEGEILTRGPLHEAYAKAVPADPEPGILVSSQPPEPIEEVPPEQRPAEEAATWLPGYWAWDDDRDEFIWISGVWRVPPPGEEWVPGYWNTTAGGYQWVSGYWWNPRQQDVAGEAVYLPQPPQTLEVGPSSPAPAEENFWVPGCWTWREVRYVWRPGYWAAGVPDWVWIPSHYVWTPGGCLFIAGHWDYTLERRGLVFAPIYFPRVVYTRPAFRYVPSVVINTSVLGMSLFVRPSYCHYYFGDYYAPAYRSMGIVTWFSFHGDHRGYDPLFAYHYWRHGRDRTWLNDLRHDYEYRVAHVEARPPRTYTAMHEWMAKKPAGKTFRLAARLNDAEEIKELPVRLHRIDEHQRERYAQTKNEFRQFTEKRQSLEQQLVRQDKDRSAPARAGRPETADANRHGPHRVQMPETPLAQFKPESDRGERRTERTETTGSLGRGQTESAHDRAGRFGTYAGRPAAESSPQPRQAETPTIPRLPDHQPDRRSSRFEIPSTERSFQPRVQTQGLGTQPPATQSPMPGAAGGETSPRRGGTAGRSDLQSRNDVLPSRQEPAVRQTPQQYRGGSSMRFDRSSARTPQVTPAPPSGRSESYNRSQYSARNQAPQRQPEVDRGGTRSFDTGRSEGGGSQGSSRGGGRQRHRD